MSDLFEFEIDGTVVEEIDLGTVFAGTKKEISITATSTNVSDLTNVIVTCIDDEDSITARKVVLGGNEINEDIGSSYVFASLDGVTWYELAALNKYMVCVEEGDTLSTGESFTFYLKAELPANALINFQNIAIYFRAEEV